MDARERTCWDDRREALSAQCLRRACMQQTIVLAQVPAQVLVTIFFPIFFSFRSSNAKTKINPFVNREMLERLSNSRVRIKDSLSKLSTCYYCCASVDFITGAHWPCSTVLVQYGTVPVPCCSSTRTKRCGEYFFSLAVGSVGLCHKNSGPNNQEPDRKWWCVRPH